MCYNFFAMKSNWDNPFKLDPAKITNPKLRFWVRIFGGLLERLFRFPALARIYNGAKAISGGASFSCNVLEAMGITWSEGRRAGASGSPIPAEGPVVVVANHPFGGIEGVLMLAMLEKYRPDAKVLVNFMLSIIPELRKDFLFVNPFGGNDAKRENMRSMKASLKWLEEGHVLAVFPAGEVSSMDRKAGFVRDIPWSTTIARMIRKSGATVVPIFFEGDNGRFFNFMGRIHPRLRTALLPHELVNKRGRHLRMEFGEPIAPRELSAYATDESLTTFIRLRTYILADRVHGGAAAGGAEEVKQESEDGRTPIIPPVDTEKMRDELATLPSEARLCEGDGLVAYIAKAQEIPSCLREIGRLREVTYREVGEGTGAEIDIDSYDEYYRHLLLWNPEKMEIAGAYRLGLTDEILPERGVEGLYVRTCFVFDREFIDAVSPAIELGRSFIRKEYQRAFSSLLLLWKGICTFIVRNPRYVSLFGPVSISNDYSDSSKEIIMRSMRLSAFDGEHSNLVGAKLAPKPIPPREWLLPEYDFIFADMDAADRLVREIEPDGRPMPILVRQYLKMGGKVLRFNVDPDFNYCIDGMVDIKVAEADERMMRRYMGSEQFAGYRALHGYGTGGDSGKAV